MDIFVINISVQIFGKHKMLVNDDVILLLICKIVFLNGSSSNASKNNPNANVKRQGKIVILSKSDCVSYAISYI